jgi:hypothetical protein
MAQVLKRTGKVKADKAGGTAVKLSPEVYFLKYAFPCAFIGRQKGRIDEKTYLELEEAAIKGRAIAFSELAKYFPVAVRRISALARRKRLCVFDAAVIRDYFWKEHNKIIEAGEEVYKYAPTSLRELCKVMRGRVVSAKGGYAVVRFINGKIRPVVAKLVHGLKCGDRVMVHYGYAVEKLSLN